MRWPLRGVRAMSSALKQDVGIARAIDSLGRLHPTALVDSSEIRRLLDEVRRQRVSMHQGMNRRIDLEEAEIESIELGSLILRTRNFESHDRSYIFLNFTLEGQPYFFAAPLETNLGRGRIRVGVPVAVYRAERRSRHRHVPGEGDSHRVALRWGEEGSAEGEIADASPEGISVCLPDEGLPAPAEPLRVQLLDGVRAGNEMYAEIRSRAEIPQRRGWVRVGLDLSTAPRSTGLRVERRDRVLAGSAVQRVRGRWKVVSAGARVATNRALSVLGHRAKAPEIRVIDYANDQGENIRAIVDAWGDSRGATAVVIPPAWGRTKETLLPLAVTLVAGFQAALEPIVVIRFDGIRKRGESYKDPDCRAPDRDHRRFTFSQGVRDIRATVDFLERSPDYHPKKVILVSFSAASIESRRAVATDPRIGGWVSVVGAADTQSMMRVISGGIDYVAGVERGVSFGLQEVLGVEVDIDHAGKDLFEHSLPFLDDSRRDFAEIRVPVTWIHGRHDAWMNAVRAQDVLARGSVHNRKFIEIPTGHMLKTSREALEAFQLVASEVSLMALGRSCPPILPDLNQLGRRQIAERDRRPRLIEPDLRIFWRDYLIGRDGKLGIELMTHTNAYNDLMKTQVESLDLRAGQRVADLGSGTGAFPVYLAEHHAIEELKIFELDYVREGFARAYERLGGLSRRRLEIDCIATDLDQRRPSAIPLAPETVDAVLASFFLSYVEDPAHLLGEIHRILRPGGRLVLSSLRRDADLSKLYSHGITELRSRENLGLGIRGEVDLDASARDYLNQASKLLDLEESGRFRFWDLEELTRLVRNAGFVNTSGRRTFGDPPQAIVVSANRS